MSEFYEEMVTALAKAKAAVKCQVCGEADPPLPYITGHICTPCFRAIKEQKSVEDRLLELEAWALFQGRHQHVENMRF